MTFLTLNTSKRLINLDHVSFVNGAGGASAIALRFMDGHTLELRGIEAVEFWNACLSLAQPGREVERPDDRRDTSRFIGVELDNDKACPRCRCTTSLKEYCYVCEGSPKPGAEICPACSNTHLIRTCAACGANYWHVQKIGGSQL